MKIETVRDSVPQAGLVCRQSRLAGAVMAVIFTAAFFGGPLLAWYWEAPLVIVIMGGLVAAFVVPFVLGDVVARFRHTNWLLWIGPGGLWVNLRSYQDRVSTEEPAVLKLSDGEIAEVRRFFDRFTTPADRGGTAFHKVESLEIVLREPDSGELAKAIAAHRRREQPQRVLLGFIRSRQRLTHYSVSLPEPNVIRLLWQDGRSHAVTPRLKRVLAMLESRLLIGEPRDREQNNWQKLNQAEFDDRLMSLVLAGNQVEAIRFLERGRGYSKTHARQFVRELEERG